MDSKAISLQANKRGFLVLSVFYNIIFNIQLTWEKFMSHDA